MASQPALSLSQLQVLLTIVEAGSFTAAAKRLNRATSVISYTIDMLEAQLGLALFHRGTARRARLTKEGEAVVAEARAIALNADRLRARVKGLREGLEAELSIALDEMLPIARLAKAVRLFTRRFPTVALRLNSETMGGIEHLVRAGRADIGIGGAVHTRSEGLAEHHIQGVPIIPVAAGSHPLAQAVRSSLDEARRHLQVVVTERYADEQRSFGVVSDKQVKVTSLAAKHGLILEGIGWGGMPEPMVRSDLISGRLVRLSISGWTGGEYVLQLLHRSDALPGPAGQWLIEHFLAEPEGKPSAGREPAADWII